MCPQIACPRECIVALAAFVLTFLCCMFSNESSNGLPQIFQTSPQIINLRRGKVTLVAFILLFPTVCFQVSLQCTCVRRSLVTLVAMPFLSTVYLQIACMKRSIVTLAAIGYIAMLFFCCVFAKQRLNCEKIYQAKWYNVGDMHIRIIYWCNII